MSDPVVEGGAPSGQSYSIQVQGLDALLKRLPTQAKREAVVYRILSQATMAIRAEAIRRIAKRTSNTARTITSLVDRSAWKGYVGVSSPVGLYLEQGTGLFGPRNQRIYPTHARALRWPIGASGAGFERADMGLAMTSGLFGPTVSTRSLRRTGTHTAAQTKSGKAQFAFRTSIAGMRRQPFFLPAYQSSLPVISLTIDREAVHLFDEGVVA